MIENFNSYEGLFACEELDNDIRNYIMSIADKFEYRSYTYGPDYDEKYVQEHKYYTKNGDLIASIERENGEYFLRTFNRCVVRDIDKESIQKKVNELNKIRIDDVNKAFTYLDNNNMKYELKRKLKRDCFKVTIHEKEFLGTNQMIVEMKDKRFDVIYTCKFYSDKKIFEKDCETTPLNPWQDDCNGRILSVPTRSTIGVAGELEKYFSTKLLEKKNQQTYKYAITEIPNWYMKEYGVTLIDVRRERKVKKRWFGF